MKSYTANPFHGVEEQKTASSYSFLIPFVIQIINYKSQYDEIKRFKLENG